MNPRERCEIIPATIRLFYSVRNQCRYTPACTRHGLRFTRSSISSQILSPSVTLPLFVQTQKHKMPGLVVENPGVASGPSEISTLRAESVPSAVSSSLFSSTSTAVNHTSSSANVADESHLSNDSLQARYAYCSWIFRGPDVIVS